MNRYIRYGVVSPKVVLPLVEQHFGQSLPRPTFHGYKVGVSSLRMKTFQHDGLVCRGCGLKASFFAVEDFHNVKVPQPHLNLYGVNDEGAEVLFTHDHRLARGLGGADNLSNVQTMCSPCNNKKSRTENPQLKKKKEPKLNPECKPEFRFENPEPDSESKVQILREDRTQETCAKTE